MLGFNNVQSLQPGVIDDGGLPEIWENGVPHCYNSAGPLGDALFKRELPAVFIMRWDAQLYARIKPNVMVGNQSLARP